MNTLAIILAVAGCSLAAGYLLLCLWLIRGWRALPVWEAPEGYVPRTPVTVLVPARNEAVAIRQCLDSLLRQDYPSHLLEIIVIDDHSDDDTAAIVEDMAKTLPHLRLLRLAEHLLPGETQSYKKKAIETGVACARGELIVATDADCVAPAGWLAAIVSLFETRRPQCILGPVGYFPEVSFLERFQSLDLAGLMLCTGAMTHRGLPLLANGANMAYAKSAFEAVGGYSGADRLASGDDLMLAHKIAAQFPGRVLFLKNAGATVRTAAQSDWHSFWQQRIRWATKTNHYRRPGMTATLAAIFLFCIFIAATTAGTLVLGWKALCIGLSLFLIKSAADYLLLREACRFFQQEDLLRGFLRSEAMHIAYMIGAGVLGNVVQRYEWKGRRVR
ncbi:MAG: glycosyltransferase [Saprospiraceae bacterium]|nr:glycosyltransferase [Saprospiraceae bacterium]